MNTLLDYSHKLGQDRRKIEEGPFFDLVILGPWAAGDPRPMNLKIGGLPKPLDLVGHVACGEWLKFQDRRQPRDPSDLGPWSH